MNPSANSSRRSARSLLAACAFCLLVPVASLARTVTWEEEARQIDGTVIRVQREITLGGIFPGQGPGIMTNSLTFQAGPGTPEVRFTSDFDKDIGTTDFRLLAVYILDGSPHVVARPYLCNSYMKWMRPNPPYVVFAHRNEIWERVPIDAIAAKLPLRSNLFIGIETTPRIRSAVSDKGIIEADTIAELNSSIRDTSFTRIGAERVAPANLDC